MTIRHSMLDPYATLIKAALRRGKSLADIAKELGDKEGVEVTRQAVGDYVGKKGWKKVDAAPEKLVAPNLFVNWFEAESKTGKSVLELVEALNIACGTHYRPNFISQLKSGAKGLERTPAAVRNHMVRVVLGAELSALGIPEKELQAVIEAILI